MELELELKNAVAVALEDMLAARERRAAKQREFLTAYRCAVVSFTLNLPGAVKDYPLARTAFDEGCSLLEAGLAARGMPVVKRETHRAHTGCELLLAVDAAAEDVKAVCIALEESHPLGRLFDMDVLCVDGAVHGEVLGRAERRCIVCGGPVWSCARSRAHTAEELALRCGRLIRDYYRERFAARTAQAATRALLYEVSVTPKPGLVDRANNGSHRDMDIFTFLDSSAALTQYFHAITRRGLDFDGDAGDFLSRNRCVGEWAEQAMLAATGGVNTHKGLLFSLGILCAGAGMLHRREEEPEAGALLALGGGIASETPLELDFQKERLSHGEQAYRDHGVTGARGEAALGFPHVREIGYPILKRFLAMGWSRNDAGVAALLHLMAAVADTNILARADLDTLLHVQKRLADRLPPIRESQEMLALAEGLDREFIARNISPGGSADLLALSFFLLFFFG